MTRRFHSFLSVIAIFSLMTFQSCKEDTTPPTITVIGSTDITIAKGAVYTDLGATAEDDKDESVYIVSDYSSTNPDMNLTGEYTITYTAQDRNANITKAERKVFVTWTGTMLSFSYNVVDTCLNDTTLNQVYSSTASSVFLEPFRTNFTNLMNSFSGDTYMYVKGNAITIPAQTPSGAPTQFSVSGSGTIINNPPNIIWDINYTVTDATPGPTLYRHAVFIY